MNKLKFSTLLLLTLVSTFAQAQVVAGIYTGKLSNDWGWSHCSVEITLDANQRPDSVKVSSKDNYFYRSEYDFYLTSRATWRDDYMFINGPIGFERRAGDGADVFSNRHLKGELRQSFFMKMAFDSQGHPTKVAITVGTLGQNLQTIDCINLKK